MSSSSAAPSVHGMWARCLSLGRWTSYFVYGLYTCLQLLCEVIAGVLEIPTDAPQYDALMHQASNALTYEEWLPVAATLDDLDGFQQWRTDEHSPYFSFEGVMRTIEELLELHSTGSAETLLEGLHKRVHRSLCGISHHRLYAYRTGTKTVIHSYTSLVCFLLGRAGEAAHRHPPLLPRTREVLAEMHHVYGTTALVLQGGVLAAGAHLGVAKALYEAGLLPPILYGSGSGALIATLVCCCTDLPSLFDLVRTEETHAIINSAGAVSPRRDRLRRLLRSGEVVDPVALDAFLTRTVGDVTFAEAYARTGRVLNIPYTAAPSPVLEACRAAVADHQLLNYLTAPDVVVRSAVRCAMCAISTRLPASTSASPASSSSSPVAAHGDAVPRRLLARARLTGAIVVYDPPVVRQSYPNPCGPHTGSGARDPLQRMRGLFAVRFTIVSDASLRGYVWRQVQLDAARPDSHRRLRLWRFLRYCFALCFLGVAHVVLRVLAWLGYDAIAGPSSATMTAALQLDEGETMLLYPIARISAYLRLWWNPSAEKMAKMKMDAQREVWPHLEQLRMSMSVEQVLAATLKRLPTLKTVNS